MSEYHEMAVAHLQSGELDKAEAAFRKALQQDPSNAQLLNALAYVCHQRGNTESAIDSLQQACQLVPDNQEIRYSLAGLLELTGRQDDAMAQYREILGQNPSHAPSHVALSVVFIEKMEFSRAIDHIEQALAVNKNDSLALYNLGLARMRMGQSIEADECFTRALQANPGLAEAHTCRLHNAHNIIGISDQEIFELHTTWAKQFGVSANGLASAAEIRDFSNRPLRIGYVSADFRKHSVAYFCLPVFKAHNKREVETFCYSNVTRPDAVTDLVRDATDNWRDISTLDDDTVTALIKEDLIDILVDLSGHTDGNRLPVFAHKPAPVQVTWLGYPDTTGLSSIDYRITDKWADPVGKTDCHHVERLARIEPCFLCYSPMEHPRVETVPPSQINGYITFGSFNNLAKLSEQTLTTWAEILSRLPDARLLLKAKGLGEPAAQDSLHQRFAASGITPERIECVGHIHSTENHLALYNRIDIALDSFPYNGTTTTCEALWMSVPVITLAGSRHASRVGYSILQAAGMPGLTAFSRDEYINLAVDLATDTQRLAQLRKDQRERLSTTALMDSSGFTRSLEQLYRKFMKQQSQ